MAKQCRKGYTFCQGCNTQKPALSMGTIIFERTGRVIIRCFDCIMADLAATAAPDFIYTHTTEPGPVAYWQQSLFPTPTTGDDDE